MNLINHEPAAPTQEPDVSTSTAAGTVVVVLDPDQAKLLARILVQHDAVMRTVAAGIVDPIPGYQAGTWHRTAIALIASAVSLGHRDEAVPVPCYRSTAGGRP